MTVEDTLADIELFSQMPRKDLNRLAKMAVARSYTAGDIVVKEGELGVSFFVVTKGKLEVIKGLGSGNELVLATFGPGSYFGEMALFDNQVRSASVRAAAESECLVITKWDFNAELNAPNSKMAIAMLPILARRIRALDEAAATH